MNSETSSPAEKAGRQDISDWNNGIRSEGFKKLTIEEITLWQKKKEAAATIGEWKALGRELKERHALTTIEAINILNNNLGF